jgi:hypothetical protein
MTTVSDDVTEAGRRLGADDRRVVPPVAHVGVDERRRYDVDVRRRHDVDVRRGAGVVGQCLVLVLEGLDLEQVLLLPEPAGPGLRPTVAG